MGFLKKFGQKGVGVRPPKSGCVPVVDSKLTQNLWAKHMCDASKDNCVCINK